MEYTRGKLILYWFLGGLAFSILGIIISVNYWANVNPEWELNVISEIVGASLMLPIGWVLCPIFPMMLSSAISSWFSILTFIWACKIRQIKPLYLSYIACFSFGIFWPKTFWAMMGI